MNLMRLPLSDLIEPKNALTKQFIKLLKMDGVELDFRPDALTAVAKLALERKIGARGLRSVLEHVLLDIMYDLPSLHGVSKVVIDEATIKGESTPLLIFENDDQLNAAPDQATAS